MPRNPLRSSWNMAGAALLALVLSFGPSAAQITVGTNVQVSVDRSHISHNEIMGRAHPTDSNRMIACSQANDTEAGQRPSSAYLTTDGGKSWQHVSTKVDDAGYGDPVCFFTRGDTALFVLLGIDPGRTMVYRSVDGGRTWPDSAQFGFIDREYAVHDATGGEYDGRIYVSGTTGVRPIETDYPRPRPSGFHLYRSLDGGRTFLGPTVQVSMMGRYVLAPGPSVVLSDGTLGMLVPVMHSWNDLDFGFRTDEERSNATLQFFSSSDGGEKLNPPVTISEYWMDAWPWKPKEAGAVPFMAVDPGSEAFKDRLYVVWSDKRTGHDRIMLSYSADKGKSWSPAKVIQDGPVPLPGGREWDNIHPTVAVNKDGVVGVAWYDRRESPDNVGWHARFTASLDGGETWLPSVRVSEHPSDPGNPDAWLPLGWGGVGNKNGISLNIAINSYDFSGGDTDEMLVDADGVFHPLWIDNRTGVHQIWTAPVRVGGKVVRNGSEELASLEDRSDAIRAFMRQNEFDPTSGALRFNL
jgi:hypothetical protein